MRLASRAARSPSAAAIPRRVPGRPLDGDRVAGRDGVMTDAEWEQLRDSWSHLADAGEQFARRVAKDARKFAERVEVHVEELSADLRREWDAAGQRGAAPDVRRVVEELRGVVGSVLGTVDDFVTDLFAAPDAEGWSRRACTRETTCSGCGRPVAPGAEAWVRGRGAGRQ